MNIEDLTEEDKIDIETLRQLLISREEKKTFLDAYILHFAKEFGYAPANATINYITIEIRNKLVDKDVLYDAITGGHLPEGSDISALTIDIIQNMIKKGEFCTYKLKYHSKEMKDVKIIDTYEQKAVSKEYQDI